MLLVAGKDYCTPEDLRVSPFLNELGDIAEIVSDAELAAWEKRPDPISAMQISQNAVLDAGRRRDPSIENFADLDRFVLEHPEWDAEIAQACRDSGYLDIWRNNFEVNPWHYDVEKMDIAFRQILDDGIRLYCVSTIQEFYSGGLRFAVNLHFYRDTFLAARRETTALLIRLYEQLVRNDQLRRDTAITWLEKHFPDDVARHLERIVPHSELWFSIVDGVEPNLGAIARMSIANMGSKEVCSSCGDPANDYRLVNSANAMPGVPSLRLCDDCVEIRQDMGEVFEAFS